MVHVCVDDSSLNLRHLETDPRLLRRRDGLSRDCDDGVLLDLASAAVRASLAVARRKWLTLQFADEAFFLLLYHVDNPNLASTFNASGLTPLELGSTRTGVATSAAHLAPAPDGHAGAAFSSSLFFLPFPPAMETFSHATQADLDAIYRHVPLPAPASTISIACTQSSRAFTVSFKPEPNGASRLITWGSIHIRSGAAVSTLTLGPGRFPPASPFTLYSSAVGFPVPGRYAINVELRMEEDSHEWEVEGGVDQPQQEVEVPEDLKNYARLATSELASALESPMMFFC